MPDIPGPLADQLIARKCTVGGCGTWGYCDTSLGRCICAPGRSGHDCSELLFGACRLHEAGEMACMTFTGLMSCACRQQCEWRMGGGSRRHAQVCWDWASPEDRQLHGRGTTNLSDLPDVPGSAIVFRTPSWPPIGRCAKPDPPRHCGSKQGKKMHAAAQTLGDWPLPDARCPLSCSHRGTCLQRR